MAQVTGRNFPVKLFNQIYKCVSCEKLFNLEKSMPTAIGMIMGVGETPTGLTAIMNSALICPTCFEREDLELKKDPPPQIIIPELKLPILNGHKK